MTSIIFASVSWKDDCDKGGLSLISHFYKVGFALKRPHRVKGSRFKRSPLSYEEILPQSARVIRSGHFEDAGFLQTISPPLQIVEKK